MKSMFKAATTMTLALAMSCAMAQAPQVGTQAPGYFRLAVGDYLGADHGRVVAIHEEQLELVELFPDGEGAWLERPRTLVLNVNS